MSKLTATGAAGLVRKGEVKAHADGGNLYLKVTGKGAAKWTFRFMRDGRAREMGLGAYDAAGVDGLTLAEARDAAADARKLLKKGVDPIEQRRSDAAAKGVGRAAEQTFEAVAEMLVSSQESGWRNEKHRAQWRSTLRTYAYPVLGGTSIIRIDTESVLAVLQPIWTSKPETASRVRGRIEAVLSYASVRGWRSGENPARWKGHLDHILPKRSKIARVEHHAALPWQDLPSFMSELRSRASTAARALEFTILAAARTNEALGARWSEIDLNGRVWTVPAARMKAGREHRVPLSEPAVALLKGMLPLRPDTGDSYVFPGQRRTSPLSSMSMLMLLRRMGRGHLTVHGFRSTFRDWAEEETSTPHAVSEAALAHTIGNKAEAAYRRGDLFKKRAELMEAWARFCSSASR
ncbi:tyrosine-type recombinase/integrase [Prosthecomicrobium sp. N25]|uniref:tyrosine-type recombinase/integrase n=1 Tax=Prosthecomicrobium sp. N25 TaxID=3129254 RepID=UPI003076B9AC